MTNAERLKALTDERNELVAKLEKLNNFIYNGSADSLSYDAASLLHEQKSAMEHYVCVLNKRIMTFRRENFL